MASPMLPALLLQIDALASSALLSTNTSTSTQSSNPNILSPHIVDSVKTLRYYSWRCNDLLKYEAENPTEDQHLKHWFLIVEKVAYEVRDVLEEIEYELACYKAANGAGRKRKFEELSELSSSFGTKMEQIVCNFCNHLIGHTNYFQVLRRKGETLPNQMGPTVSLTNLSPDLELTSALRSLKLGYDLMPNHLKPCFAYCSFFPEGQILNKHHLIKLWIAQGYVQPESGITLTETGLNYFHDLVERSFFQQVGSADESGDTYKMHHLIHVLCKSLSRETEEQRSHELCDQPVDKPLKANGNHYWRTYLYSHCCVKCDQQLKVSDNLFVGFRLLRALELSCNGIKELPDSIGNLKHLRYLLLRCNIKYLPDSICNLYLLQMLDLCGCSNLLSLSKSIGYLRNLWFIGLPLISREDRLMSDMIIPKCYVPESVRELTSLQTLGGVFIGRDLGNIKELSSLVNLRDSFCISGLENISNANDAKYADFKAKKFLTKLCLQWRDPRVISKTDSLLLNESVLDSLEPSTSVEQLDIIGFGGYCFPKWLSDSSFSKLTRMKLVGCRQNCCESLPSLGQLPSLKYIFIGWMHGVKNIGREFCCSSLDHVREGFGFPSLEEIVFENMDSLAGWSDVANQDFPLLRSVMIKYCCRLIILPVFATLTELCLTNCSMLEVFPFSPNLKSLKIIECGIMNFIEFDENLSLLENLRITFCWELKSITGLNRLSSLRSLKISSCYKLQHLDEGIFYMLEDVGISDCPALIGWCESNQITYKHIIRASEVIESHEMNSLGDNSSTSPIYGRDDEIKEIIDVLLSDYSGTKNVEFVAIVGSKGIGKTRIARHVYNDTKISEVFETRIWVNVPEKIDEKVLMKDVIESLTNLSCDMIEPPLIQNILQQELSGKKFLLVLDGSEIENKSFWTNVKILLNICAKGSFVIVTSRSELVGNVIGATHTIFLNQLPEEHCWLIFQQIFKGCDPNISPTLIEKGKKLVMKCKGNPMYIRVLIGYLRPVNEERWGSILESDMWKVDEHDGYISPVLRLAFYLLPPSLKKSFGYCSLFPKNYIFSRQHIVHQWLSHGFIEPTLEGSEEDTGIQYFNNLFSRSFFEYSPFHDAQENKYLMPPLIHDLAAYFSRSECFTCEESHKEIPGNIKHMALVPSRVQNVVQLASLMNVAHNLYSLVLVKQSFLQKDSARFHFANFRELINLFPQLRSLRTLDLSYSDIDEIPPSICYLENIVYLGLNRTNIERLPDEICTLVNLRFFEARDCYNLVELPENMKQLTHLEYLDVRKECGLVRMPLGIGELTNLRSLSTFNLGDDPMDCSIGELKNLVFLTGHLQIAGLENIRISDAKEGSLSNKKYIEYLTLHWCGDRGYYGGDEIITTAEQSLEILKPVNTLKELIIRNYIGNVLPPWLGDPSFSMLASITLDNCCNCEKLPALSHLPSLRHLYIRKLYGLQRLDDLVCSSGRENTCKFPSLELLNLWEMYELEEMFEIDGQDFPRLHTLSLSMCSELKCMPSFSSLMELSLHCCDKLLNIPALPSLKTLKIQELQNAKFLHLASELPMLKKLEVNHCNELLSVEGLSQLTTIDNLKVVQCPNFHSSINLQPSSSKKTIDIQNIVLTEKMQDHEVETQTYQHKDVYGADLPSSFLFKLGAHQSSLSSSVTSILRTLSDPLVCNSQLSSNRSGITSDQRMKNAHISNSEETLQKKTSNQGGHEQHKLKYSNFLQEKLRDQDKELADHVKELLGKDKELTDQEEELVDHEKELLGKDEDLQDEDLPDEEIATQTYKQKDVFGVSLIVSSSISNIGNKSQSSPLSSCRRSFIRPTGRANETKVTSGSWMKMAEKSLIKWTDDKQAQAGLVSSLQ